MNQNQPLVPPSTMQFVPAVRTHAKARIALIGPAGSGKTLSALKIAKGLGGKRIGLIDSERESSRKHAGKGIEFSLLALTSFSPRTYVEAMRAAVAAGIDVLIIDGLSQAWAGKDGALEMVDAATKRSQSKNSFVAWREVTPEHNRLVDALTSVPLHLIVTMRAKTEWVLEDVDNGKGGSHKQPRKVGMAPIQRDGLEYEFDIVGDLTLEHDYLVSKSRCELYDRQVVQLPGEEFGSRVLGWLNEGAEPVDQPAFLPPTEAARRQRRTAAAEALAPVMQAPAEPPAPPPAELRATFSRRADWPGAAEWAGKPLDTAPVEALDAYAKALDLAIANPKNKARIRALADHTGVVKKAWHAARLRTQQAAAAAAAAALAEDPFADVEAQAEAAGWDLSGQGAANDDDNQPQPAVAH